MTQQEQEKARRELIFSYFKVQLNGAQEAQSFNQLNVVDTSLPF